MIARPPCSWICATVDLSEPHGLMRSLDEQRDDVAVARA